MHYNFVLRSDKEEEKKSQPASNECVNEISRVGKDAQLTATVCKTLQQTSGLRGQSKGRHHQISRQGEKKKKKADLKQFAIEVNKMERVVNVFLWELFNLPVAARTDSCRAKNYFRSGRNSNPVPPVRVGVAQWLSGS